MADLLFPGAKHMDPRYTPPPGNPVIGSRPPEEPLRVRKLSIWIVFAAALIMGAVFYFLYGTHVGSLLGSSK